MLSKDQAQSIITEAKLLGMSVAFAESTDQLIGIAQEIYEEAKEAYEGGAKGEGITTILSIAENINLVESSSIDTYNNLPIPSDYGDTPPEFPRDISVLSDRQLRTLHAEFAAMLARANWLLAIEETDELTARQMADLKFALAIRTASDELDQVTSKPKTVSRLEAEAAGDEEVREWRAKQNGHYVQVKLLKALRDNYQMICERISREWTMREKELIAQAS